MIHRHTLGLIPAKPHTTLYSSSGKLLMEYCATRQGFDGIFSILYYENSPTDEFKAEQLKLPAFCPPRIAKDQSLKRRALGTDKISAAGNYYSGRKTLFCSDNLQVAVCKPCEESTNFFSNGDGDELYFVYEGEGVLESPYGLLPFKKHDYLLIPKATPYRITCSGVREESSASKTAKPVFLIFEGRPFMGIPKEYRNSAGQISMYAPYSHRDFKVPESLLLYDVETHGTGPFQHITKWNDSLSIHYYKEFPFAALGWDGLLYPVAFNIHDFQPKTGLVHLPPTIHTTFAGQGFVVCSFVPRIVDYHPNAIPCPYAHGNNDMDELIYYVAGNFSSRKGVGEQAVTLHPRGISHGPHPGRYKGSIGTKKTEELAVMCDTYGSLLLTETAISLENPEYHKSWV